MDASTDRPVAGGSPAAAPFASHAVWLSPGQWGLAILILAAVAVLTPILWERIESLPAGPNCRIAYRLNNDYWIYSRYNGLAAAENQMPVLGDSVVWGHYVDKDETLSAYLNQRAGRQQFANVGIDGMHPAAMAGLVEYYARGISRTKVVLHCNLLWTSSKRHDLQVDKEFAFNHPALVPQFFPRIPCYKEPLSGRIGAVIGRRQPFLGWARHLQIAYFDNNDVPTWTLDHPYVDPLRAVTLRLPSPDEPLDPPPGTEPWTRRQMKKFAASWVELAASFQWESFRRMCRLLEERGNRLFVVVGPFNEHMLTPESLATYQERKRDVQAWLAEREIPHLVAEVLPSEEYADASHPLAAGYERLARQLWADPSFVEFRSRP